MIHFYDAITLPCAVFLASLGLNKNRMRRIVSIFVGFSFVGASFAQVDGSKVKEFIGGYGQGGMAEEVAEILANAEYKQGIIDKMGRPAEGVMTWGRYRKIFLTEGRIRAGAEFWGQHRETIASVSEASGVPEEIIVGIIGIETFYGRVLGGYRVLDALYTLAFGYPKRSAYFKSELGKFLEVCKKEKLDIYSIKGSYAGAIGYCQFMPSSYLAYARDFDGDRSTNLMEANDAIASAANYLAAHKWDRNGAVAGRAERFTEPKPVVSKGTKPGRDLQYYAENGYMSAESLPPGTKAALLKFEGEKGSEFWFGFWNFYVITRYNHSPMYALAVYQLAEEVKKRYGQK